MSKGRLIVLAGPSCAGKSPLDKAMARFYPELRAPLQPIVLYNDREPRPGEADGVDYHFRDRASIEALGAESGYVVMDVRGDMQAVLSAILLDPEARRWPTSIDWTGGRLRENYLRRVHLARVFDAAPVSGDCSRHRMDRVAFINWSPIIGGRTCASC